MTRPPTLPHRGDGLTRTLLLGGRSLPQPGTPRIPSQRVPYDINLTATNAAGSDDEIKPEYIEVTGGTSEIELTIIGNIDEWNLGLGQNEDVTTIDLGVTTTASSLDCSSAGCTER